MQYMMAGWPSRTMKDKTWRLPLFSNTEKFDKFQEQLKNNLQEWMDKYAGKEPQHININQCCMEWNKAVIKTANSVFGTKEEKEKQFTMVEHGMHKDRQRSQKSQEKMAKIENGRNAPDVSCDKGRKLEFSLR